MNIKSSRPFFCFTVLPGGSGAGSHRAASTENGQVAVKTGSGKYKFTVAGAGIKILKINAEDYTGKYKVTGPAFPCVEIVSEKGVLTAKTLFFSQPLEVRSRK